ncbi:unnamed protein product [Rotaria socialis]|uniref:NAD(P)(+)--arginine ADP-ribosyltransferase n=3 Tax=Rotaria socialis TaxID=392032 RepID=A0A817WIQ6_9BILA|nr:unnamed protein product [Rotaria socialis]CAF4293819.1 unnamed protein product [Rotaria socialis]
MTSADRFLDADQEPLQRLSSIQDYRKESLVKLEDAVKIIQLLTYDYECMVLTAKRKMYCPGDKLTVDEAAAIYLYTMWYWRANEAIAIKLNRVLRSGVPNHVIPWASYIQLFVTGLNKLPSKKGTVWCGARGDITAHYQNECIWTGFSPCTGTKLVIDDLLNKCAVYTMFEIECINGKSIRDYSEDPNENEVLLMPGTRFRVMKKEDLKYGSRKVYLKEVESQSQLLPQPSGYLSSTNQAYRTDQGLPSPSIQPSKKPEVPQVNTTYKLVVLQTPSENQKSQPQKSTVETNTFNNFRIDKPSPGSGIASVGRKNEYSASDKSWLNRQYHDDSKQMIMTPEDLETKVQYPASSCDRSILNRVEGSMLGMALGDALGAHVEFRPRQYLEENPVQDLQEGGTWGLKKGQFTDDTSMALCLAASLVCRRDFVPYDQLVRYKWWYRDGYMSSTGQCFDIGAATSQSLREFERRQKLFANEHSIASTELDSLSDQALLKEFKVNCSEDGAAGNGALMRLAPVPLFFYRDPIKAVEYSGISGIITHGDQKASDACRYYGALIVAALRGETKAQLLDNDFYLKHREWFGSKSLTQEVLNVAQGSYKKPGGYREGIRGKGYIVSALEAALWAFCYDDNSFEKGVLDAVNLGDDTDTTAAIYGQLAGAHYGYERLPERWKKQVYASNFIKCLCKWIVYEGELCNSKSSISKEPGSSNQPQSNVLSQSISVCSPMSTIRTTEAQTTHAASHVRSSDKYGVPGPMPSSHTPTRVAYPAATPGPSNLPWASSERQTFYSPNNGLGYSINSAFSPHNDFRTKYTNDHLARSMQVNDIRSAYDPILRRTHDHATGYGYSGTVLQDTGYGTYPDTRIRAHRRPQYEHR